MWAALRPALFLSTPSARRATHSPQQMWRQCSQFLSTPSARRATVNAYRENKRLIISIHALCEEGDAGRAAYLTRRG